MPSQPAPYPTAPQANANRNAFYNLGLTFFKSAFIVLCIVAFETLAVFFLKDRLNQKAIYYATVFAGIGFITFVAAAILYASRYKPHVKRKKNPSYVLTSVIVFVIATIAVMMIAVYFKADVLSNSSDLLSYVVVPVCYLINVILFAALYYMFSTKENKAE